MGKNIVILSFDEDYIYNFLRYVRNIGIAGYDIVTFTDEEKLDAFIKVNEIDIFITDIEKFSKKYGKYNFILTESDTKEEGNIYRYLPISRIVEKILLTTDTKLRTSYSNVSVNSVFSIGNQETKIMYFNQLVNKAMNTALIINLDTNICSYNEEEIDEIVYFSNQDLNKGVIKLNGINGNVLGKVKNIQDIREFALIENVLRVVEMSNRYDELFFILPETILGFEKILEISDSIKFITDNNSYDEKFLENFYRKYYKLSDKLEIISI